MKSIETGSIGEHTHETIVNTPPLEFLTALVAALMALLMAVPAWAQVPTVGMSGFTANQCAGGCPEQNTACTQANINIGVGVGFGNLTPRTDLEVRLLALTRSGHNRFRDYGVPVYVDEDDSRVIRSLTTVTIPAGSDSNHGVQISDPICWRNDHLVTGDSEVEIVIVGGAGYRVDPSRNGLVFTIVEDDDCANPGSDTLYVPMGGNMNNTCVCRTRAVAAELYPGSVKQADGQDWDHTVDDYYVTINGNRSLRSSNDQSRYCPESPYQGPGS